MLWKLTGTGGSFSSSPATDDKRIYFGNSGPTSRGPLVAVKAGATGDLTLDSDEAVAWVQEASGPGMASPVVIGGHLYTINRGILSCYNAETGDRIYRDRLPGARSIASSLWAAGDKLFILDEDGNTFVISTGDKFELLSKNTTSGLFWATPSVVGKSLLLRSTEKVICVRQN